MGKMCYWVWDCLVCAEGVCFMTQNVCLNGMCMCVNIWVFPEGATRTSCGNLRRVHADRAEVKWCSVSLSSPAICLDTSTHTETHDSLLLTRCTNFLSCITWCTDLKTSRIGHACSINPSYKHFRPQGKFSCSEVALS